MHCLMFCWKKWDFVRDSELESENTLYININCALFVLSLSLPFPFEWETQLIKFHFPLSLWHNYFLLFCSYTIQNSNNRSVFIKSSHATFYSPGIRFFIIQKLQFSWRTLNLRDRKAKGEWRITKERDFRKEMATRGSITDSIKNRTRNQCT